jgi:hypothetical protein
MSAKSWASCLPSNHACSSASKHKRNHCRLFDGARGSCMITELGKYKISSILLMHATAFCRCNGSCYSCCSVRSGLPGGSLEQKTAYT